jgi:hypothetical protein
LVAKAAGKVKIIDEVHEIQQPSPSSFVARTTRRSSETSKTEEYRSTPSLEGIKKKRSVSLFYVYSYADVAKETMFGE